jgi:hypothetical protein
MKSGRPPISVARAPFFVRTHAHGPENIADTYNEAEDNTYVGGNTWLFLIGSSKAITKGPCVHSDVAQL